MRLAKGGIGAVLTAPVLPALLPVSAASGGAGLSHSLVGQAAQSLGSRPSEVWPPSVAMRAALPLFSAQG